MLSTEIFRDCTAVDGDEWLTDALALTLDGAGDQLLADAGFAFDQNRNIGGGGTAAKGDDAGHCIAAHDEIGEGQGTFDFLFDAA